jgi:hypothetical protein
MLPKRDRAISREDESSYATSSREESSTNDVSSSGRRAFPNASVPDDVENRYFGRSENRDVRNLKALVVLVLFLVTLAVCLAIYFVTANGQQDEFEAS